MESSRSTLEYKSLGNTIAEYLKNRIWNKEILLGERLVEGSIAEEYEVSRSTIRSAFKILEEEGIVVQVPRKGSYVAEFSNQDKKEILELRVVIEIYAFKKAVHLLNDNNIKELSLILKEMQLKVEEKNWNDLFNLDLKFHKYIVSLSGNSRAIKVYDSIQSQIRTFLSGLDVLYSDYNSFFEEQKRLYDVFLSRDFEKIENELRNHIMYVEGSMII